MKNSSSRTPDRKPNDRHFRSNGSTGNVIYKEYLSEQQIENGLMNGQLYKGFLKVNSMKKYVAYVKCTGATIDILIENELARNRCFHGDEVIVRLLPRTEWSVPISAVNSEQGSVTETAVDENLAVLMNDKLWLRQPNANESISSRNIFKSLGKDDQVHPIDVFARENGTQPAGIVVGLASRRRDLSLVGSLEFGQIDNLKQHSPLPASVHYTFFKPNDNRFPKLCINRSDIPEAVIKDPFTAKSQIFLADIDPIWPIDSKLPKGKNVRNIGESGSIHGETEALLIENGVNHGSFQDEIVQSLQEFLGIENIDTSSKIIPWSIPEHEVAKRRDLRGYRIFTIDPSTAKDLDDALHITPLEDGTYEIGVHIADVSYFVHPNTPLDQEAWNRATTVYLVQKVIPMLPPILCEQLCSLNPNVDRLAFSCIWRMNRDGTLCDARPWFGRTIIRSCAKLDYATAQRMVDGTISSTISPSEGNNNAAIEGSLQEYYSHLSEDDWEPARRPEIGSGHFPWDIAQDVSLMHAIAANRRASRLSSGAIVLNNPKLTFRLDAEGNPSEVNTYLLRQSNQLVEEYMLLANYLVAQELVIRAGSLAFLRKHPPPKLQHLAELKMLAGYIGIELDVSSARTLQQDLSRLTQSADPVLVQAVTACSTRPMQLAEYFIVHSFQNDPLTWRHYALSIPYYTHFTSPIRRYADIVVHRLLGRILDDGPITDIAKEEVDKLFNTANQCNDMRNAAKSAQERSDEVFFSVYLMSHPMDVEGIVVGIGQKSFSVLVPSFGLQSRLFVDEMRSYDSQFDEERQILTLRKLGSQQSKNQQPGKADVAEFARFTQLNIHLMLRVILHISSKTSPPIGVHISLVDKMSDPTLGDLASISGGDAGDDKKGDDHDRPPSKPDVGRGGGTGTATGSSSQGNKAGVNAGPRGGEQPSAAETKTTSRSMKPPDVSNKTVGNKAQSMVKGGQPSTHKKGPGAAAGVPGDSSKLTEKKAPLSSASAAAEAIRAAVGGTVAKEAKAVDSAQTSKPDKTVQKVVNKESNVMKKVTAAPPVDAQGSSSAEKKLTRESKKSSTKTAAGESSESSTFSRKNEQNVRKDSKQLTIWERDELARKRKEEEREREEALRREVEKANKKVVAPYVKLYHDLSDNMSVLSDKSNRSSHSRKSSSSRRQTSVRKEWNQSNSSIVKANKVDTELDDSLSQLSNRSHKSIRSTVSMRSNTSGKSSRSFVTVSSTSTIWERDEMNRRRRMLEEQAEKNERLKAEQMEQQAFLELQNDPDVAKVKKLVPWVGDSIKYAVAASIKFPKESEKADIFEFCEKKEREKILARRKFIKSKIGKNRSSTSSKTSEISSKDSCQDDNKSSVLSLNKDTKEDELSTFIVVDEDDNSSAKPAAKTISRSGNTANVKNKMEKSPPNPSSVTPPRSRGSSLPSTPKSPIISPDDIMSKGGAVEPSKHREASPLRPLMNWSPNLNVEGTSSAADVYSNVANLVEAVKADINHHNYSKVDTHHHSHSTDKSHVTSHPPIVLRSKSHDSASDAPMSVAMAITPTTTGSATAAASDLRASIKERIARRAGLKSAVASSPHSSNVMIETKVEPLQERVTSARHTEGGLSEWKGESESSCDKLLHSTRFEKSINDGGLSENVQVPETSLQYLAAVLSSSDISTSPSKIDNVNIDDGVLDQQRAEESTPINDSQLTLAEAADVSLEENHDFPLEPSSGLQMTAEAHIASIVSSNDVTVQDDSFYAAIIEYAKEVDVLAASIEGKTSTVTIADAGTSATEIDEIIDNSVVVDSNNNFINPQLSSLTGSVDLNSTLKLGGGKSSGRNGLEAMGLIDEVSSLSFLKSSPSPRDVLPERVVQETLKMKEISLDDPPILPSQSSSFGTAASEGIERTTSDPNLNQFNANSRLNTLLVTAGNLPDRQIFGSAPGQQYSSAISNLLQRHLDSNKGEDVGRCMTEKELQAAYGATDVGSE